MPAVLLAACTQLNHSHDRDGDAATRGDGGSGHGDDDGGDRGSGESDGAAGGSSGHAGKGGQGGSSGSSALDGGDASSPDSSDGSADAASDDGDDGGDDARTGNTAPVVTIEFPLNGRTDADTITVRGVVRDAESDAISSLTVNGIETTVDADGAFSQVVQLALGTNRIDVIAQDVLGATSETASVTVERGEIVLWLHPTDVALDYQSNRAFVVDPTYDAVFAVDLASGVRTRIADANIDLGPPVTGPSQIEVDYNNHCAYVLTGNASAQLQRIDLTTLDRTVVPLNLGSLYITALTMDSGKLYAAGGSTFFEIQLPGGTPRMISDDTDTSLGPALQAATALAIDSNHGVAYLVHQYDGTIKAVGLGSGTRTLFTGGGAGSGPNLSKPLAAVYDYGNQRVLVTDEMQHGLFAISTKNADYGVRSILADASTGTGVAFGSSPGGFAFDSSTQRALIADWQRPQFIVPQRGALTWVELDGGHRTRVSNGVGSGQGLAGPSELIADPDDDRVLMVDYSSAALLALHLGTGNRLVLSDAIAGQGPPMVGPVGMVADFPNHRVFVADGARKAVFSIDLTTGDRTLLSDNDGHGGGAMFEGPTALIYDAPNDRLLVADSGGNSKIMSVNLNGGNRLVLSDNSRTGPSLDQVRAIAFAPGSSDTVLAAVAADLLSVDLISGNRVYQEQHDGNVESTKTGFVLEQDHWYAFTANGSLDTFALLRIELADGSRTVLSGTAKGTGPLAFGIAFNQHMALLGRVMLVSQDVGVVLAIDTVSGDRIVFSM